MRLAPTLLALTDLAANSTGQQKMLDNHAAMRDLRCARGFIRTDGWWSTNQTRMVMERETR